MGFKGKLGDRKNRFGNEDGIAFAGGGKFWPKPQKTVYIERKDKVSKECEKRRLAVAGTGGKVPDRLVEIKSYPLKRK
ncbi:MAG: hypothetical protein WCQ23_07505 [Candidatus Methanomethylophilaceae archaeon]